MITPLRWLFRVVGLLPNNTHYDKYFTCGTILGQLLTLCTTFHKSLWKNSTGAGVVFEDGLDIVFVMSGVFHLVKVYVHRKDVSRVINKCLLLKDSDEMSIKSTKTYETCVLLAFSFCFVARVVTRVVLSHEFVPSLVYDIFIGTIYCSFLMMILMVRQLSNSFSLLNYQLRQISASNQDHPNHLKTDLASVFKNHILLRELLATINSHFGHFVAGTVSSHSLYGTYIVYVLIMKLVNKDHNFTLLHLLTFFSGLTSMVSLFDACYRCSEEVGHHFTIIYKLFLNLTLVTSVCNRGNMLFKFLFLPE